MSRTADGAARSIEHDEQPPERGQELEDQLSQEQFNDELQKDLEVMFTQEKLCEEEGGLEGRDLGSNPTYQHLREFERLALGR